MVQKTNVRTYWIIWFAATACLIVLRLLFRGLSDGQENVMFVVYLIITWTPIVVKSKFESEKLLNYIKVQHREKWDYLTWIPIWGSGGHNGFRIMAFLFSKDDLGDPKVAELKSNYKCFRKPLMTVFFSVPIIFLLIKNVY